MLRYLLPENGGSIVLLRFTGGEGSPTTLRASTSITAQVMCDFMRLAFRSLISHKTFILNRHHHLNLKFNDYFIKKKYISLQKPLFFSPNFSTSSSEQILMAWDEHSRKGTYTDKSKLCIKCFLYQIRMIVHLSLKFFDFSFCIFCIFIP